MNFVCIELNIKKNQDIHFDIMKIYMIDHLTNRRDFRTKILPMVIITITSGGFTSLEAPKFFGDLT